MDKTKAQKVFLPPVPLKDLLLTKLLTSSHLFDQRRVYALMPDQTTRPVHAPGELQGLDGATIKVEGLESLSRELFYACRRIGDTFQHDGLVTAHLFIASAQAASFPMHIDPDDIVLQVVTGTKDLIVNDEYMVLHHGEALFMPRNTPHQALNTEGSVMLSFGLENYAAEKL